MGKKKDYEVNIDLFVPGGWALLVVTTLCLIVALTSRSRTVVIVVMVISAVIVGFVLTYAILQAVRQARARRADKIREKTPWDDYSRPILGSDEWEVGVFRLETEEEIWRGKRADEWGRLQAEGEAMRRVEDYNYRKVGM